MLSDDAVEDGQCLARNSIFTLVLKTSKHVIQARQLAVLRICLTLKNLTNQITIARFLKKEMIRFVYGCLFFDISSILTLKVKSNRP